LYDLSLREARRGEEDVEAGKVGEQGVGVQVLVMKKRSRRA